MDTKKIKIDNAIDSFELAFTNKKLKQVDMSPVAMYVSGDLIEYEGKQLALSDNAFHDCYFLTAVSFPSCSIIGYATFDSCSSLTTVSFPNCNIIGSFAFEFCPSLTTVSLPNCSIIEKYAFQYCQRLESLYLPGSIVCELASNTAFAHTPMHRSNYLGYYGSIYVPNSLLTSYKTATNWTFYSDRFVGI